MTAKRVVHIIHKKTGRCVDTWYDNPGRFNETDTHRPVAHLAGEPCQYCEPKQKENPYGFPALGYMVGELVEQKNAAYGESFAKSGEFLRLLYPNGIQPHQYDDMLCIVRIFDKLMRIANQKDAFNESPFQDIVGYGLLGMQKDMKRKEVKEV